MGQERFADIVERFTNGYTDGVSASAESVGSGRRSSTARCGASRTSAEMVSNPVEPRTGVTPREEVYRRTSRVSIATSRRGRTARRSSSCPISASAARTYFDSELPGDKLGTSSST